MLEVRLVCDVCGAATLATPLTPRSGRKALRPRGWTSHKWRGVKADFCAACSALRSTQEKPKAKKQHPEHPGGVPIPGFPGYTVDKKPDGTWGVRGSRPPWAFRTTAIIQLRDANGQYVGHTSENWVRLTFGERVPTFRRRMPASQVRAVFDLRFEEGMNLTEIARSLDVDRATVDHVLAGTYYAAITADLREKYQHTTVYSPRRKARRPIIDEPARAALGAKLSNDDARSAVVRYFEHGEPADKIAQDFGVHRVTIHKILRGESYRDATEELRERYRHGGRLPTCPRS